MRTAAPDGLARPSRRSGGVRARLPRARMERPPRQPRHSSARTRALLDGVLFRPRPEPLIPAKRLEMGASHPSETMRSAEIGPKARAKRSPRPADFDGVKPRKTALQRGFWDGASRTRTGGLLGAIQGAQRLNVAILQGTLARSRQAS